MRDAERAGREKLNYVDFSDSNKTYAVAVKELIYACQDPSFDLTAESPKLYSQALALESPDPERAALLFQRILDRDPTYFGGQAQRDLKRLNQRLYPQRAQRLLAQAEASRKQGAYGAEAGALEALIALGDQDPAMLAWAQEYLPVAQQNRALLGPYEVIQQRVVAGDLASARDRLTELWRQAPYYRDPAGIAPKLGLTVPMTYEEAKERRQADEAKTMKEVEAATTRNEEQAHVSATFQGRIGQVTFSGKESVRSGVSNERREEL